LGLRSIDWFERQGTDGGNGLGVSCCCCPYSLGKDTQGGGLPCLSVMFDYSCNLPFLIRFVVSLFPQEWWRGQVG
jgi:hypothetical protein